MHTETISGLHKCQPKNEPKQGEVKNMVIQTIPAKGDKKAYIKIKNQKPEEGGSPYRILKVERLPWEPDNYGNVNFNLVVEASSSQPSAFQQARSTMQQGRVPRDLEDADPHGQHGEADGPPMSAYDPPDTPPRAVNTPPARSNGGDGVTEARKHLMQSANLYNLCVAAVDKAIAPWMPEVARTSEQFQAAVASLFIEASKEQWWSGKIVKPSLIESMPTTPLQHE